MYYIAKSTFGKSPDTLVYCIWNNDWSLVCDVELTVEEAKKFAAKKKKVTLVSWMQVLAQSDEKLKTGTFATEVTNLKDLKG